MIDHQLKLGKKHVRNPDYQPGDDILFSERTLAWRYLPSFREALSKRKRTVGLLRSVKRPRKHPLTALDWMAFRADHLALADKIEGCCRAYRCGSLACPVCMRADALVRYCKLLRRLEAAAPGPLCFMTIVPELRIQESRLADFCPKTFNESFHKALRHADVRLSKMFGVAEISYEEVPCLDSFFQPHWHLICDPPSEDTLRKLRATFPGQRAVYVEDVRDPGILKYLCKTGVKGYRGDKRRVLPLTRQREVARWLDRCLSLDFLLSERNS